MIRLTHTTLCFFMMLCMAVTSFADTVYLKDGSTLTGLIIEDTPQDCIIATTILGDLALSKSDILLQEMDNSIDHLETFTITRDAATVISRVPYTVPTLDANSLSFNKLITGEVQAICDSHGLEVPFTGQLIGNNTLITIQTRDILPDTHTLIATTLQDSLIQHTPTGHLSFTTRFIPNQAQSMRIVLKYPKHLAIQTISPEPQFQRNGLILWEQTLKRQQTFSPIMTCMESIQSTSQQ